MIKERIRAGFLRSCQEEYAEKVAAHDISYDKWMRNLEARLVRETGAENPEEGKAAVEVVTYDALAAKGDFTLTFMERCVRAKEDTILIFTASEGALTGYAKELIRVYFTLNPDIGVVYGDEDTVDENGIFDEPFFKPDFSPDLYLCCNYIGSVFAVRTAFMKRVYMSGAASLKVPEGITAPQDMLFFRLTVCAGAYGRRVKNVFPVGHIDEILFHRKKGTDLFCGRDYTSVPIEMPPDEKAGRFVSVIIPSKDNPVMLGKCIDTLRKTTEDADGELKDPAFSYEILVIDNGSSEEHRYEIETYLSKQTPAGCFKGVRYYYEAAPFNFAAMCNLGAREAKGDIFLFLNDDVLSVTPGFMQTLVSFVLRPYAGAVGMKLLYPQEELIQHCGIANVRVGPVHKLQRLSDKEVHYFGYNRGVRDCIGVTGACLMITRGRFLEAGGFKEVLAVAFNDVELCYTLYEAGYYNICVNYIHAVHHESFTRGDDTEDLNKVRRLDEEYHLMMERHVRMYNHDPFYHKHLTDNENISGNVRLTDLVAPSALPAQKARRRFLRIGRRCRMDAVVRVGVEYAGTVKGYEMEENFRTDETALGYYVRGYSFVIGSDNAVYERHVLLQPLREGAEGVEEVPKMYFSVEAEDVFRPDIAARAANQVHVEVCGFHARLKADSLPPGRYRVGILATDIVTGVKLFYFGSNLLTIR